VGKRKAQQHILIFFSLKGGLKLQINAPQAPACCVSLAAAVAVVVGEFGSVGRLALRGGGSVATLA
jgi:hypothetical protein